MAAPRATQLIALRNLARAGQQSRHLHMTGPSPASPVLTKERPTTNLPRDIAGLRAECKRRKIDFSGSKQDQLVSRLSSDELAHSRAFSTAIDQSKRPAADSAEEPKLVRHFNTSRSLKAVGDSSFIDFAYLPALEDDDADNFPLRVPILHHNFAPPKTGAHAPEAEDIVVMKPEISTMSADAVFLPMADMSDGHSLNIDFHAMADRVAVNLRTMKVPVEEQAGLMKQIWSDMVDDMLGLKKKAK